MENENFDEELKNRIKQVFDDYEDETAVIGWKRLREKFPQQKRRDYIFWWVGSAAALLLVACLFYFFQLEIIKNNRAKIVRQSKTDTVSALHQVDSSRRVYANTQNPAFKKAAPASLNTKKTSVKTALVYASRVSSDLKESIKKVDAPPVIQPQPKKADAQRTVFTGIKEASINPLKQQFTTAAQTKVDSSQQKQQPVAAQLWVTTLSDSSSKKQPQQFTKSAEPVVKKPLITKKAATETVKKLSEKVSKFSFGLYVGTHLNYATGSNNQLGLGAGFSTDFRVGKKLQISTGLGLMQNKLSYNHGIPVQSQNAAFSYATVQAVTNSAPTVSTQNSNLTSVDASLLSLDIPINLTYTILPGKNSISVSAGLGSNTFVKEVYTYNYNTNNAAATSVGAALSSTNSTQSQQSSKSFANFNFAKTLNLAVGFAYPLGKNKLQIEPFLKYPLGGMGSQQLFLGSAGVNLKITLQSLRK